MVRKIHTLLRPFVAMSLVGVGILLACGVASMDRAAETPLRPSDSDKGSDGKLGARPDKSSAVNFFGTLSVMTADEAHSAADDWLRQAGKDDAETRRLADAIWADDSSSVLDCVAEILKLGSPAARELLSQANDRSASAPTAVPALLKNRAAHPFLRANLALAYAKALSDRRIYEEALDALKAVRAEQVVDPALYLFLKALAEYSLCLKEEAEETITRLLDDVPDAPERYKNCAALMSIDMSTWKNKDLGWIERKMGNIERRLQLSRGGPVTQQMQREVVARLNELIKEKELQRFGANAGNCPDGGLEDWGQPDSGKPHRKKIADAIQDMRRAEDKIQSSSPQKDSNGGTGTGPGSVDAKKLRELTENWGRLPERDRAKALAELARDMPPRYRDAIENYFHKAGIDSQEGARAKTERTDKGSGSGSSDKPEVWHADAQRPTVARVYLGDKNSLDLISLQVSVTIDGPRARTVVDHIFHNPHGRTLEGTFEYPLPTGASPSYFAMFLGQTRDTVPERFARKQNEPLPAPETLVSLTPTQLVKHVSSEDWGTLREARIIAKDKALETYEEVTRRRIDPALLEYAGGNTFSGRVFPIPPRGYNRVILAYEETMPVVAGKGTYRFALPDCKLQDLSFTLQGSTEQCPDAKFQPKADQTNIGSRTYINKSWKLQGPGGEAVFTFKPPEPEVQAITGREGQDGPLYLYARLRPELKVQANKPFAEHAVFLLDTSLSEHPDRFDVNMKLMRKILEKDADIKRFNVLTFNVGTAWVEPKGWIENDVPGRKRLFERLDGLVLEGATDVNAALEALAKGPDDGHSPIDVFLLSDGQATWGPRDAASIAGRFEERCKFPVRFHCYRVGLGAENQELFEALTRQGGGIVQCHSEEEIDAAAVAHRQQCLQITGVRIKGKVQASDVMVAGRQAAVYPGGEVVVAARLQDTGDARIILEGTFQGEPFRREYSLIVDTSSVLAPRAWAEVAVASLLALNDPKLDKLITAYCQHYAVGSRLASFLVLENDADYTRFNLQDESDATLSSNKGDLGKFLQDAWKAVGEELTARAEFTRFLGRISERVHLDGPEGADVRRVLELLAEKDFELPATGIEGALLHTKDVPAAYRTALGDRDRDVSVFLDEAKRRRDGNDIAGAVRALSGIIEQYPSRSDALRLVGYRLLDMEQPAQAAGLFRQVQRDRPFEPHSYRDLARTLEDCHKYGLAALQYEVILAGEWHARFHSDLKTVVREEYIHMMREALAHKEVTGKLAELFDERLKALAGNIKTRCDLRVTITWNSDNTDVDLWVFEPDGTKCFYEHRNTKNGGVLSEDCTRGYGPERFQAAKAMEGEYRIAVHYFNANPNLLAGETHVQVLITRFAGTPQEQTTRRTVVLKKGKELIEVAQVKF